MFRCLSVGHTIISKTNIISTFKLETDSMQGNTNSQKWRGLCENACSQQLYVRFLSSKSLLHLRSSALKKDFVFTKAKDGSSPSVPWRWVDNCNVISPHSDILLSLHKERNWHLLPHGWTLNTLCQLKQFRHKRTTITWFHIYEVPRIVKSIDTESGMVGARAGEGDRSYFNRQSFSFSRWKEF